MLHIPYYDHTHRFVIQEEFLEAQKEILYNGRFINGPHTRKLEHLISQRLGYRHAIATNSGTTALYTIAKRFKEHYGSPVAHVSHYTYQSVFGALVNAGLKCYPTKVDNTYLMDLSESNVFRDDLFILTGLLGQNTFSLPHFKNLVIDASQNWQGLHHRQDELKERDVTTFLSFDPSKSLGGFSTGGMILTNDDDDAKYYKHLIRSQVDNDLLKQHIYSLNFRMSEVEALYLHLQIPYIDLWKQARITLARKFDDIFGISALTRDYDTDEVQKYAIRVKDPKSALELALRLGIEARVLYQSNTITPLLGLPLYPKLKVEEVCNRYRQLQVLLKRHKQV